MSDDSREATPPARALVIGNSYLGAVIRAARDGVADVDARLFDFAAAGGVNFSRIAVEGGQLRNARISGERLRPIADYRAIFIYGYLPGPIELIALRRRLRQRHFSAQVIALALHDAVALAPSIAIADAVAAATTAPVRLLPGNPPRVAGPSATEEQNEMLALVRGIVGDRYVPAPAALLTADGTPDPGYYTGSLTIQGEPASEEARAKHDIWHFNVAGGALILAALTDACRAIIDAPPPRPPRAARRKSSDASARPKAISA